MEDFGLLPLARVLPLRSQGLGGAFFYAGAIPALGTALGAAWLGLQQMLCENLLHKSQANLKY